MSADPEEVDDVASSIMATLRAEQRYRAVPWHFLLARGVLYSLYVLAVLRSVLAVVKAREAMETPP